MKFSIITASYNQASFLQRSLDSVRAQTYKNFEHLIHDGLSSDGSQEILKRHAAKQPNVSLVIEPDDGQVEAINNGLRRATGDILTWINTDDFLFDETVLTDVAQAFQNDAVDVVYGRGWYVDTSGNRLRDVYVNREITGVHDVVDKIGIFQPALYFRRRVVEKMGLLDRRYQLTLDYEYWIRLLANGARFKFIDRPLAKATLHSDSKTCGLRTRQLVETALLVKERFGYVHPSWIKRLREHTINNSDWTAIHHQPANENVHIDVPDLSADSRLTHFASSPIPRLGRLEKAEKLNISAANRSRVVATSFNDHYFAQGLNLIASIHAHCRHSIDAIVVYDLGMTPAQLSLLGQLRGVVVQNYPSNEPWEGYFHPKTYAYKCHAIRDARKHLTNVGTVLWVDAGVCVTGPLDEILDLIEDTGIFLINHDDRKSKTLINAAFTHPNQVTGLSLTASELEREHVCSCVVGYRTGSVGQNLIDQAYELSLVRNLNDYTKHPKVKWQNHFHFGGSYRTRFALQDKDASKYAPLANLAKYPYYGHRQDQSLYSNLAALMGCPVRSASKYCPATDYSSAVSFQNWRSGGEYSDIQRSTELPENFSAPLYHHRGTYSNLCGLKMDADDLISAEMAIVLGNGPSLKDVPFAKLKGIATIGMNAAYRYWDIVGWYPTYYCCMDTVVINSHAKEIKRLIDGRESYGIKLFFLRRAIVEVYPELEHAPGVLFLEDIRPLCPLFQVEPITTGSYSLLFLAFIGFRRIYIAGVDCNYVERVTGTTDGDSKNKLVVKDHIENNPNYFFDGYQQKGDQFNLPNPSKDLHVRSWRNASAAIRQRARDLGEIAIVNLNGESRVDCFANESWRTALQDMHRYAVDLGRSLFCDLSMPPDVRARASTDVADAIFFAVTGNKGSLHQANVTISHREAIGLTKVVVADNIVEYRFDGTFDVNEQEVVSATFVVLGLTSPIKVTLLDIKSWETPPTLSIPSWGEPASSMPEKFQAIYPTALDAETGLLLISAKARSKTRFVGLKFETQEGGAIESINAVKCIGISISEPAAHEANTLKELRAQVKSSPLPAAGTAGLPPAEPRAENFGDALLLFRQGKYSDSLRISTELARKRPDFKWYGVLAEASKLKIGAGSSSVSTR